MQDIALVLTDLNRIAGLSGVTGIKLQVTAPQSKSGFTDGQRTYFFLPGPIPQAFALPASTRAVTLLADGLLRQRGLTTVPKLLAYLHAQAHKSGLGSIQELCVTSLAPDPDGVRFRVEKSFTIAAGARMKCA